MVGLDRMIKDMKRLSAETRGKVEEVFTAHVSALHADIVDNMTNTPTNPDVAYYKHNKRIPHHPSLPYNAPAVDTGALRRSISEKVESDAYSVSAEIGSTLSNPPYPVYLEYGTTRMAPRPWLAPAVKARESELNEKLRGVLDV